MSPDEALLLLKNALQQQDCHVELLIWSDPSIDWDKFDAIIIRSTWDYTMRIDAYRKWILYMKEKGYPLYNHPDLVLWNLDKRYLCDLEQKEIRTIPTRYTDKNDDFTAFLNRTLDIWPDTTAFVIKPSVSVGAYKTKLLKRENLKEQGTRILADICQASQALIQPYLEEIIEGEISLIFLNGQYSYAIHKKPATGDFRVQAKHGGILTPYKASEKLIEEGQKVLSCLTKVPLCARVDGIIRNNNFLLMELEINEPGLYEEVYNDGTSMLAKTILTMCTTAKKAA